MTDTPFFFLHLPRTGGTSLIAYLDRKMVGKRICPAHEMFEFEHLESIGELRNFDFYRGHFGINLPDRIACSRRLITFMRSPVERLFSVWRHLRVNKPPFAARSHMTTRSHRNHQAAHALDFKAFCKYLAKEQRSVFNEMAVRIAVGRGWNVEQEPKLDHQLLDRAKRSLDQFDFIGFTELFDPSVEALQRRFGWEVEAIARHNAAPNDVFPEEDPAFLNWLSTAAELDIALYEHARAKTRQRYGGNSIAISKTVIRT